MPSLKEFRLRIASVKSTQKITKALQMVATAKLKRAQEAAQAARPYAQRMASVIANLASGAAAGGGPKLIAGTGSDDVHLLIVMTSERGLAGGFNTNIVKLARAEIRRPRSSRTNRIDGSESGNPESRTATSRSRRLASAGRAAVSLARGLT